MNLFGHKVKVELDHGETLTPEILTDILTCVQNKTWFCLITKDRSAFIFFTPENLTASCNLGWEFKHKNLEEFIDTIKFSLYEYTDFINLKEKQILMTRDNPLVTGKRKEIGK